MRKPVQVDERQQMLPMWAQGQRGLPNAFARSALFSIANKRKGERVSLKREPIAALQGITIAYTGEELRQDDEDVFLQIIHLARLQELGTPVQFIAHAMIQELNWSASGPSYKRLVNCLDRLNASSLSVTVEDRSGMRENYTGSLIRSFRWRQAGSSAPMREWEVLVEREIVSLFSDDCYTRVDWKTRLSLNSMEKWLHSFYHSHALPYPISVGLLHELTGSEIPKAELRKFRYKLRKALENLVEIGFFISASVCPRTDKVFVERLHRPAQPPVKLLEKLL